MFKANVASFSRRVEERIQPKVGISIEDRWKHLKNTVVESAKCNVGYKKGNKIKKPWITAEMMGNMNE